MRLVLLLPLALLGCPTTSTPTPDAGPTTDAGNVTQPQTIAFTQVKPTTVEVPGGLVRGTAGELFGTTLTHVFRSTDSGRTFEQRAAFDRSLVSDEDGTLYGVKLGHLLRSTDSAATFTDIPIPDVVSAREPFIAALRGGIVWLLSSGSTPAHLYRSADKGSTFTEVTPPAPSDDLLPFKSLDSHFLLHDRQSQHLYRTLDGTTWEDLHTPGNPSNCLETRAGNVVINAYVNQGYTGFRQFDGGWTPLAFPEFGFFDQRPNGGLLHQGSSLSESLDEGATWQTLVGPLEQITFNSVTALDDAILGESPDTISRVEPDAGWVVPPTQGLPQPNVGRFGDIAFSDDGRIVLAGDRILYLSNDQGVNWHSAFHADSNSPIRAVAYRPDGKRIFAGTTQGRYTLLDEDGTTPIYSADLEVTAQSIRQAIWTPARFEFGQLFVTTAKDDASDGALVTLQPEYFSGVQLLNPFRIASSPATIFPSGYSGLGITKNGPQGPYVIVGTQRHLSTTQAQNGLRTEKLGSDEWSEYDNPTNNRETLSISASGPYGQAVAILFEDSRLYMGGFSTTQAPVTVQGVLGDYLRAKFAPDGHLWLITTAGIYRSNDAYGTP